MKGCNKERITWPETVDHEREKTFSLLVRPAAILFLKYQVK